MAQNCTSMRGRFDGLVISVTDNDRNDSPAKLAVLHRTTGPSRLPLPLTVGLRVVARVVRSILERPKFPLNRMTSVTTVVFEISSMVPTTRI